MLLNLIGASASPQPRPAPAARLAPTPPDTVELAERADALQGLIWPKVTRIAPEQNYTSPPLRRAA
jgi:hypothetical protein